MESLKFSQDLGKRFAAGCRSELEFLRDYDVVVEPYAEAEDSLWATGGNAARNQSLKPWLDRINYLNHRWAHLPNFIRVIIKPQRNIHGYLRAVCEHEELLLDHLLRAEKDDAVSEIVVSAFKRHASEGSAALTLDGFSIAGPSKRNRLLLEVLHQRMGLWAAFERSYPFDDFPKPGPDRVVALRPLPNFLLPWKTLNRGGVDKALCARVLTINDRVEEMARSYTA